WLLSEPAPTGPPEVEAVRAVEEDIESVPVPPPPPWPVLPPEALQGLVGEIISAIEPHTEADPVAVLARLPFAFGSAVGRGPYFQVEGDRHHANLFLATVGSSSTARKGTSWGRVRQLFQDADSYWLDGCVKSGLSSGEGLVYHVRDADDKDD